jgi:hypothetical protein
MKKFFAILAIVAAGLFLAGCGPSGADSAGPSQYVGTWVEDYGGNGTDSGDRFVVTQSGSTVSITCTTQDYTFSQISVSGGSLTFFQNYEGDKIGNYTLRRSGNNLVGTDTAAPEGGGGANITWSPSS